MTDLTMDLKTKLLGMVCAGMDGRDPRNYTMDLSGEDCVLIHNVLKRLDDLLRARWLLFADPGQSQPL